MFYCTSGNNLFSHFQLQPVNYIYPGVCHSSLQCVHMRGQRFSKYTVVVRIWCFEKITPLNRKLVQFYHQILPLNITVFEVEKVKNNTFSWKKIIQFLYLYCKKANKAQQQCSSDQKHKIPVCKKIFKWYQSMVRCKSYGHVSDKW